MNKKGLKNFFDLIFFGVVSFFMLLIIGTFLMIGVNNSNDQSIINIESFTTVTAGLTGTIYNINKLYDFSNVNLEQAVLQTQILEGQAITTCYDYLKEQDCTNNKAKISAKCKWENNICQNDE